MDLATVDHLLTTTRSVRKRLDFDRAVEPEIIAQCLEIAIQAPTGSNAQSWHFMVITDTEKRDQLLREAKDFYTKVLESATTKTDLALISLTYVALARLYEYYDQNQYAIKIYEKAISMGDMKGGGYQEAIVARERLLKQQ